ncbi:hypothetical protein F5J12DRAFT_808135 [Pisolithus orientalis]|uniref:uncharacterized protein n=1 Tax=Pisolithus orientalis TaxID=936130 RepID=UPI0022243CD0|nr:uncharacterized protein F5J12DRAFT_808135 [Pisolithus orientalis]KAI6028850.1 hypothetical protein F5J12DRAFT_808135 [Pisolithus orientalis]
MQSPPQSFRTAVSTPTPYATTLKRARSPGPGSPTTAERQVKRVALAIANGGDAATSVLNVNRRVSFAASDVSDPCHFPLSSSSSASMPLHLSGHQPGMGFQDDWIRPSKGPCDIAPGGGGSDENMIIDMQPHSHPYSDAPIIPEESAMSILSSPRSSSHNHHHNTTIAMDDHNTREHTIIPASTTITTTSSSSTSPSPPPSSSTSSMAPSAAYPPAIYFSPATPSSEAPTPPSHDYGFREQEHELCAGPSHHHHHQHGITTIERSSGVSSCLPPSSPCSSGPGRKQRFTMGPRVDCMKCRMGVKGHWVHLD